MLVYIDTDFRCHATQAAGRTPVETQYFDGKCATYVEGYRLIPEGQAWTREDGVVIRGEAIMPLEEFKLLKAAQAENDRMQPGISALAAAGAEQVKARMKETGAEPDANVGVFIRGCQAWTPGTAYVKGDLVAYEGAVAYVRQDHTAQEAWLPFAVGTEALYGARPAPDAEGIYPYVYNMAASEGMLVRGGDGTIWRCIQKIESMIYEPGMMPAHFEEA